MNIKYSHIVELFEYRNNWILCQIRIVPRSIVFFHGQTQPHRTGRWMQAEHWAEFDNQLRQLLTRYFNTDQSHNDNWNDQFTIASNIQVKVKCAKQSRERLCRSIEAEIPAEEIALALECVIEHQGSDKQPSASRREQLEEEYEPMHIGGEVLPSDDKSITDSRRYVPAYTPSAKSGPIVTQRQPRVQSGSNGRREEYDPYSPKPLQANTAVTDAVVESAPKPYNPVQMRVSRVQMATPKAQNECTKSTPAGSQQTALSSISGSAGKLPRNRTDQNVTEVKTLSGSGKLKRRRKHVELFGSDVDDDN